MTYKKVESIGRDDHKAGQPHPVDRTGWPKGAWDTEPDRLDWKTEAGFPAIALRHPSYGHWCGYVGVPQGHPAYRSSEESIVSVHGGITYSGMCQGHVCHVPAPGEPAEVFWLGFDFAHAWDAAPSAFDEKEGWTVWGKDGKTALWGSAVSNHRLERTKKGEYRDLAYVQAECESVGKQLAEMVK